MDHGIRAHKKNYNVSVTPRGQSNKKNSEKMKHYVMRDNTNDFHIYFHINITIYCQSGADLTLLDSLLDANSLLDAALDFTAMFCRIAHVGAKGSYGPRGSLGACARAITVG